MALIGVVHLKGEILFASLSKNSDFIYVNTFIFNGYSK